MATTFSLQGQLRFVPLWTDDISPSNLSDTSTFLQTLSIANGTGATQANAYWRDVRTVAANTNDLVDLTDLPQEFMGATGSLSFAGLRLIYIRNRSATIAIRFAFDPDNPTGDYCNIAPGGTYVWIGSGWPATAIQTELSLLLRNAGGSAATYEILIVGVLT
jgi:hypothetical protein